MIVVSKNRGTEVALLTMMTESAIEDHVIYNESAGRNSPPPVRKAPTRRDRVVNQPLRSPSIIVAN